MQKIIQIPAIGTSSDMFFAKKVGVVNVTFEPLRYTPKRHIPAV
jgi:hypothetical protein